MSTSDLNAGHELSEILTRYLGEMAQPQSEAARVNRFALLLGEFFRHQPEIIAGYSDQIETFLSSKRSGGALRGRADNLFGHLIIEFERAIPEKLDEAEEQLRRYAAIAWSNEKLDERAPYLGLATDGVRFRLYTPLAPQQSAQLEVDDVRLELLSEFDFSGATAQEVYFWLDRLLVRQEILVPNGARMGADFGLHSHAFRSLRARMGEVWAQVEDQSAFAVVRESWEKYLLIVYGAPVAGDDLWVRHTYLATLAKVMAWSHLAPNHQRPSDDEILAMLDGRLFRSWGIHNFIEEDFFSWLTRLEVRAFTLEMVRELWSLLGAYDLRLLSEDVLKTLYQELVDPSERHDLGEYYTPDWLAHQVVNRLLDDNPRARLLDPSCGSGTFLYLAVREKLARLGASTETVAHILDSVCGADIHPLAVIVAKTNILLALGEALVTHRPATVSPSVYLADTMKLPQPFFGDSGDYSIQIEQRQYYIPSALIDDPARCDRAVELQNEWAHAQRGRSATEKEWSAFLDSRGFEADDETRQTLWKGAQTLKHFVDSDRDSIWAYVIKNIYKPLFFRHRFDAIIGNPPWISLRYMESGYQAFLREQARDYALNTRANLVTQTEIAAVFWVRAADLYLKTGGMIAFVLPRSFFAADQHDALRRGTFRLQLSLLDENGAAQRQTLQMQEIWDADGVRPLFSVPTCVLIARKTAAPDIELGSEISDVPIAGLKLGGRLSARNLSLHEASKYLQSAETTWHLHRRGPRSYWDDAPPGAATAASPYKSEFAQGATIVPRAFWFVDIAANVGPFGFDVSAPPLQSGARAIKEAKKPWHETRMSGNVESRYLYATLLSTDLLPFGHAPFRLLVLPIAPDGEKYQLIEAHQARARGDLRLAQWLETAEADWKEKRGAKADNMTMYQRLNHVRGLTNQNPQARYRVLYGRSSTYITANVVENRPIQIPVKSQVLEIQGIVVDSTFHYAEVETVEEAYYICAFLNSPFLDEAVKPMQTRGLFGPRDIYSKIFDVTPIPRYDASEATHGELAQLGLSCATKIAAWQAGGALDESRSIGRARGLARELLSAELAQIDVIVRAILS